MTRKWDEPSFYEIKMDAEIGAYQDDFEPTREPLDAARAPAPAEVAPPAAE
jgi:hypothetical protein